MYRPDPTADRALGNVSRKWERMEKLAAEIRRDPWSERSEKQRRRFTGIFRRLLTDPAMEKRAS